MQRLGGGRGRDVREGRVERRSVGRLVGARGRAGALLQDRLRMRRERLRDIRREQHRVDRDPRLLGVRAGGQQAVVEVGGQIGRRRGRRGHGAVLRDPVDRAKPEAAEIAVGGVVGDIGARRARAIRIAMSARPFTPSVISTITLAAPLS
jgi:hypothetical protein